MPLDRRSVAALERLMGPWFVLDEANPAAPGVTWRKFQSLIEAGKVGPESVVRGPATSGLWRRARRAPSVATRLGLCWACQAPLPPDRQADRCPKCRAELNGPVNWPQARAGSPAQNAQPAPDAIEELIGAGIARTAGRSPAWASRRRRRAAWSALAAMLMAAATCAAVIYGLGLVARPPTNPDAEALARREGVPGPGASPQAEFEPPLRPRPLPPGAMPGELFPEVPEYRDPPPPEEPRKGEAQTKQASRPATRPADLDRQERSAKALLEMAEALRDEGKLMEAQQVLVKMLHTHDRRAYPPGAVAALAEMQDRIRKAADPPGGPSPEELARQKQSAEELFARARKLIDQGDLLAAQAPLLEILNTHHPAAWPAGALQAFSKIQQTLRQPPATAPAFFNVEVPK